MKDKKLGKFFICKSKLESSSEYEYTVEQRLELKLLFIVLSYIYMKGDTVFECKSNTKHVLFRTKSLTLLNTFSNFIRFSSKTWILTRRT